jgi:hypothetical protein
MLSKATLNRFRAEIQRRKSNRHKACKEEEKNDKVARMKSEKEELRRRKEAFGTAFDNAQSQTIDPEDDFFKMPTPSMEEDETTNQQTRTAALKYNQVCAEMGAFPELAGSSFQATGSLDTTKMTASMPSWGGNGGRNLIKQLPVRSSKVEAFPSLTAAMNTKECNIRSSLPNAKNKSCWDK